MSDTAFSLSDMSIMLDQTQTPALISWSGVLDSKDPDTALLTFLQKTRADLQAKPVVIDFRELTYINSVNILSLINFVVDISSKGGQTTVTFHSGIDWQRLTAQCLKVIVRSSKNAKIECVP